ncbi:MFS general substrate transporter [Wolfiporia cocos MD-104 SS10]|uniref:MFS general substrate transporter n=1 Tax=Wolfiporia cocos (strain MD-104) TaxID=742152 RepID=A0A2H3JKW4_WOLCO|nr:MFS general substrate transporter [Wolfiporia cocos MD-104 SS10]
MSMSKGSDSVQIDEKKTPVVEQHSPANSISTLDGDLVDPNVRQAAERKLVRLLDMRLLPTIIVIFLLNYIDRVAVTSARLQGLEQDLNLTGIQYNTVIAVLYASYVPFQIPSNMATSTVLDNPLTIFAQELAFRGAIIYGGLLISNAFGSGCVTICVGLVSIFSLPDYPHNTRWLTPAQRRLAQVRLAEDAGEADEDGSHESAFVGLKLALKDPKVPIMAVMCCSQLLGLGFINFFPTPPWILSTIVCAANAWNADRTGERFFHQCWPWWGVIIGYIIGVTTMSVGGRYVAMFLMAMGYAGFALTAVWVSNAIPRPPAKRSAAIGIVNGFGNLGNLIASYTWQSQWGPDYRQSMYIGIAALAFATFLSFVVRSMLIKQNKQLERDELEDLKGAKRERIEEAARLEGLTFEEALERKKGFRYLY